MYILIGLVVLVTFFVLTYKVVDPNEAHVVVFMGRGRRIYAPMNVDGKKAKTAYFFIPLLMKRFTLPLKNVKMDIDNIHLNDMEVAPFICDVITWLHISNPIQAAERLNLREPFVSLEEDLINIVQAVARAAAMKQEVLDIMRDRQKFSEAVTAEVSDILDKWGIELINLEVNDIRDDESKGSNVISDYEGIRKAHVRSISRQQIATKNKEAILVEQKNMKESEVARAEAEETAKKRHIVKDKEIGIAEQIKEMEIAEMQKDANAQTVEATRTLDVGNAEVEKEATIQKATGEAEAVKVRGEKEADVITLKGKAEGEAIQAKGEAEATAKDKMAEAMAKFNDAATGIEQIRAWIQVEEAKWEAYGKVASNAEIKVVNSGEGSSILGLPLNAESGANIGQMIEAAGGIGKIKDLIVTHLGGDKKPATE